MTKASNEAVDEDSDDERTLPDSDEAIIALMDDNEDMSKYIVELRAELRAEVAKMREERDEARRLSCMYESLMEVSDAKETAISRGWDCFKEETP